MNESPVDSQSRGKALPAGKEVLLPLPKKEEWCAQRIVPLFLLWAGGLEGER